MMFETLESRRLMAGQSVTESSPGTTVGSTLDQYVHLTSTGTLVIKGGDFDDRITIGSPNARQLSVQLNMQQAGGYVRSTYATRFQKSAVKRLRIEAGAGDDVVTLDSGDLRGVSNVFGGSGNDRLTTSIANSRLFGEGGRDTLTSSRRPTSLRVEPSGDQAAGGASDSGTLLFPVIDASSNALYGGAGDDTIYSFGGEDSVIGGSGDDAFGQLGGTAKEVALGLDLKMPGLPFWTDVSVVESRVGLRGIERREGGVAQVQLYVRFGSLRPESFRSIEVVGP